VDLSSFIEEEGIQKKYFDILSHWKGILAIPWGKNFIL